MGAIVEQYSERSFSFNLRQKGDRYKVVLGTRDGIFVIESAWFPTPKQATLDLLYDLFVYWANNNDEDGDAK